VMCQYTYGNNELQYVYFPTLFRKQIHNIPEGVRSNRQYVVSRSPVAKSYRPEHYFKTTEHPVPNEPVEEERGKPYFRVMETVYRA
jgi:hypothetical protein